MCSIFGFGFLNGNRMSDLSDKQLTEMISNIFIEGESHGKTAAGMAIVTNIRISIIKNNVRGAAFVETDDFKDAVKTLVCDVLRTKSDEKLLSIIGHCRLKTKGTEKNNSNNHPISAGKIVGVHNGMIGNDDEMFKMFENKFKRIAQVDSEIIFQLIDYFCKNKGRNGTVSLAVQNACAMLEGGFACGMVNAANPYILWMFRNRNPTVVQYYPKVGMVAFATDYSMLDEATGDPVFGKYKLIEYSQKEGIAINLHTNKLKKFEVQPKALPVIKYNKPTVRGHSVKGKDNYNSKDFIT